MIINNAAVAPTMHGVGQTARATIKSSARIFNFFSNMVYEDKFVAMWRELVANGMDSHVVAGNPDKPVLVTLPTTFTPFAKVRDYGTGMDHEFLVGNPDTGVESKFMQYTDASTKENTNELIGGFGIGSKAPLSYTEQFAIHSYQDGKLRVYSVFKDEDGCPSIAFLSESDTSEPNGVEVSFPVEQADIPKFSEAAQRALGYFNPLPTLRNAVEQLQSPEYTVKAESWGFRKGKTESQIVQGGIAYPINTNSVPRNLHEILGFGIDFYVPIGSVEIALSREGLSYTDATIRVLGSLVENIRPKIQEHINKMFEHYPTRWEAMVAFHNTVYGNTASGRLVEQLAHYKGVKLGRYLSPVMSDKVLTVFVSNSRYNKYGRNAWTTSRASPSASAWTGDICPRDIKHILIDDAENKPILRMRNFLENSCSLDDGVMIVRKRPDYDPGTYGSDCLGFKNDLDWAKFIEALGSPPVTYLSKVEPAVVTRSGNAIKRLEKVRGYKAARRTAEFVDTLPAGGGYFIEMDNFAVKGIGAEEIKALDTEGKPLLYFNKGDFDSVKNHPDWKSAKSKVDEQLKTYKKTHKNAALALAFANVKSPQPWSRGGVNTRLIELLDLNGFVCPKRGPMAKLNTLYALAKSDLTDKDRAMRALCGITCEKQTQMLNLVIEQIKAQYPELVILLRDGGYINNRLVSVYNKLV